jgi:hypothetical protein
MPLLAGAVEVIRVNVEDKIRAQPSLQRHLRCVRCFVVRRRVERVRRTFLRHEANKLLGVFEGQMAEGTFATEPEEREFPFFEPGWCRNGPTLAPVERTEVMA